MKRALWLGFVFSIYLTFLNGYRVSTITQSPLWKGSIVKEGDVTVVRNPKEPLYKETIIMLKEEMSIGGAAARGDNSLAVVRSLAVDDSGNIYILDEKDIVIKVFDKAGKFIRKFGRKGQGPGDLNNPGRIFLDRSRNVLVVLNGPLGLSFFGLDGTFLQTISNNDTRRTQWVEVNSRGDIFISMVDVVDYDHRCQVLKRSDPKFTSISDVISVTLGSAYDMLAPFAFWTLDRKDNVIFGFPREYEIEIINPQNRIVKKISRDFVPLEVSPDERAQHYQTLKDLRLGPELMSKILISKNHSAYRHFIVDDQDWLFVSTWEKLGDSYVYDVFDPEGRFLAKFVPPYRSLLLNKGKLYTSEEDEGGYQVVKRYALTWIKK